MVTGRETVTARSRKKRGRNHQCEAVFTAPHLSHEIIVEIMSRLPVKSLCRFKCVSKLWLSTISCPQFAKTHLDLALHNNTQKHVLMDWADGKVCSIDWESINADDVVNKGLVADVLENSLKDNPCLLTFRDIVCSSNGLICIVDEGEEALIVINPCTGYFRRILIEPHNKGGWYTLVHGFCYASRTDDYKLVRIDGDHIRIYSLRSGTWRNSTLQMLYDLPWAVYGVPLNGALHWVGSLTLYDEDNCVIVCFDLNENTIREMPAPVHDYDDIFKLSLGVINGCLCAQYRDKHVDTFFWVMREYNNGESWTKISTSFVPLDTLGLAKKGVNVQKVDRKIVLCNFENGTHGIPTGGEFEVGTYVESLISPNHYVGKKRGRNHQCEAVLTAPHLSHEIIVQIISRLPVKSLCRFKCVSKLWLSTISSPQFAKTHLDLAFQNNTQKQVLMEWADRQVCSIDWESINADDVINKGLVADVLDSSLKDHLCLLNFRDIVCSSNGLICIVDDAKEETFLVINPCTGESRRILIESKKHHERHTLVYGFVYASKSDDYKLVRVADENIRIYSLRSGTWNFLCPQMPYNIPWFAHGVPLNGVLHWVGSLTLDEDDKQCLIVFFDLNELTMGEMPVPAEAYEYEDFFNVRAGVINLALGVINGCLCAHYCDEDNEAFWVMREYNNGESWTKISTSTVPLAKKRDNIGKVGEEMILCNFENGTHGIPIGDKFQTGTYVESLISPNHYVGK